MRKKNQDEFIRYKAQAPDTVFGGLWYPNNPDQYAELVEMCAVTEQAGSNTTPADYDFSFDKIKHKTKPIYKVLFLVVLICCIGLSLYFSFTSVSLDRYDYSENGVDYSLSGFNNTNGQTELYIDYTYEKSGSNYIPTQNKVSSVKKYAVCGDSYLEYIHIAPWVTSIDYQAFYDCTALKAIFIDEDNPSYTSVNGVMYSKDLTEIIFFPQKYCDYESADLTLIEDQPTENSGSTSILNATTKQKEYRYHILDSVTTVAELAFADADNIAYVDLPGGLKTINTLGFFKCTALREIILPDGLEVIASDAFSYCSIPTYLFIPASVKEIGHHAFYKCDGIAQINVELNEDAFENNVACGEKWRPETNISSLKLFKKNVPIVYGSKREG